MRLALCSRPSGPLERAPLTALWSSVAAPSGASATLVAGAPGAPGDACEAWWTSDERYVLRVGEGGAERWYVGELDSSDSSDAIAAVPAALDDAVRPAPAARVRTMLVGRQRGHRAAPPAMRLHVRRPPRTS